MKTYLSLLLLLGLATQIVCQSQYGGFDYSKYYSGGAGGPSGGPQSHPNEKACNSTIEAANGIFAKLVKDIKNATSDEWTMFSDLGGVANVNYPLQSNCNITELDVVIVNLEGRLNWACQNLSKTVLNLLEQNDANAFRASYSQGAALGKQVLTLRGSLVGNCTIELVKVHKHAPRKTVTELMLNARQITHKRNPQVAQVLAATGPAWSQWYNWQGAGAGGVGADPTGNNQYQAAIGEQYTKQFAGGFGGNPQPQPQAPRAGVGAFGDPTGNNQYQQAIGQKYTNKWANPGGKIQFVQAQGAAAGPAWSQWTQPQNWYNWQGAGAGAGVGAVGGDPTGNSQYHQGLSNALGKQYSKAYTGAGAGTGAVGVGADPSGNAQYQQALGQKFTNQWANPQAGQQWTNPQQSSGNFDPSGNYQYQQAIGQKFSNAYGGGLAWGPNTPILQHHHSEGYIHSEEFLEYHGNHEDVLMHLDDGLDTLFSHKPRRSHHRRNQEEDFQDLQSMMMNKRHRLRHWLHEGGEDYFFHDFQAMNKRHKLRHWLHETGEDLFQSVTGDYWRSGGYKKYIKGQGEGNGDNNQDNLFLSA